MKALSSIVRAILPDLHPEDYRQPGRFKLPWPDFSRSDSALERELQQATAQLKLGRIHHRKTRPAEKAVVKAKAEQLAREIGFKPYRRSRGRA